MKHNINRQSVEYDADRYAIDMLIRMMPDLTQDELTFILLSFLTITYRANYSQVSGKGFDFSNYGERLYLRAPSVFKILLFREVPFRTAEGKVM